jgi:hypothetical protein
MEHLLGKLTTNRITRSWCVRYLCKLGVARERSRVEKPAEKQLQKLRVRLYLFALKSQTHNHQHLVTRTPVDNRFIIGS